MMYNTKMMQWLMLFRGAPARWRRRTGAERAVLLKAFALLGVARLAVLVLPFRWLAVSLGKRMGETDSTLEPSHLDYALMVGRAVRSAASLTPWESPCLAQAVAAKWMLSRRHVAATVYLGVAKDETKPEVLSAHAWIRAGHAILTGWEGHRRFTVVATFS
jgi:hypothetical protein